MVAHPMLLGFSAGICVFIVGLAVGRFGIQNDSSNGPKPQKVSAIVKEFNADADVIDTFLEEMDADNIGVYLRNLTYVPHLAGTPQDLETADQIQQHFLDNGFDTVKIYPYDVLLSYPDNENPNRVVILDEAGSEVFVSQLRQPPLGAPEENSDLVTTTFNAYSGTGTVEGDPIYAHYGSQEDFEYLESQGISVEGKIVLARYGKTYRGNIAQQAEKRGALGVVLFSDPLDYAPPGVGEVYPNGEFLPETGVQSGTLLLFNGDPLTPHYPSTDDAYRISEDDAMITRIPVQPIGYGDAEDILKHMSSENPSPAEWVGLLNASYSIGPGFVDPEWKLRLEVRTSNQRATINNVVATITGSVEPDRYVILGNHRDAWIFGAIDPTSATSILYEVARGFGVLKAQGWRPRRTLVLCSWGAEEYGLVGSVEWVEEMKKVLEARAVAYLNLDLGVFGTYTLQATASPILKNLLYESAKRVPNPDPKEVEAGRITVYDTWLHTSPSAEDENVPDVQVLGSGSDHTGFQHNVGISSLYFGYNSIYPSYPLYHTLYDTYYLVSNFTDKGFLCHKAIAQLWGVLALRLAEDDVLPFSASDYAVYLLRETNSLNDTSGPLLRTRNITLDSITAAVQDFADAAVYLQALIDAVDLNNTLEVRDLNDRLMKVDQAFIVPWGLPENSVYNHVIFSPSSIDKYSSQSFPGLHDLLYRIEDLLEPEQSERWEQVRSHLAEISYYIRSAANVLRNEI